MIRVHKRTKTTELLQALEIESTRLKYKIMRIEFFIRLIQNPLTRELSIREYMNQKNSERNLRKKISNWCQTDAVQHTFIETLNNAREHIKETKKQSNFPLIA